MAVLVNSISDFGIYPLPDNVLHQMMPLKEANLTWQPYLQDHRVSGSFSTKTEPEKSLQNRPAPVIGKQRLLVKNRKVLANSGNIKSFRLM